MGAGPGGVSELVAALRDAHARYLAPADRVTLQRVRSLGPRLLEHRRAARGTGAGEATGIGEPRPNTESKIVNVTTGEELGPGEEGEICVRGPQVMKGYLNNPDATNAMIDREGWLHTGDIGSANEAGCFFVVDRVKEMIKYKGMQSAHVELDETLLERPCIAEGAVVQMAEEAARKGPKEVGEQRRDESAEDR